MTLLSSSRDFNVSLKYSSRLRNSTHLFKNQTLFLENVVVSRTAWASSDQKLPVHTVF